MRAQHGVGHGVDAEPPSWARRRACPSVPERYSATRHRVRPRTPRSASSLPTTRRHLSSNRGHASPPALPGGRYHPTNSGTPRQIYAGPCSHRQQIPAARGACRRACFCRSGAGHQGVGAPGRVPAPGAVHLQATEAGVNRDASRHLAHDSVHHAVDESAFPTGPYRFINREYFIIQYRIDPQAPCRLVLEPPELAGPVVN